MALEIIIRRRRNTIPPPGTDVRGKSDPPVSTNRGSTNPEGTTQEDRPANDNDDGPWPFIPFPDGW